MCRLSYITPNGQVTIPRSIMKSLGISVEDHFLIEVENDRLILKKIKKCNEPRLNSISKKN